MTSGTALSLCSGIHKQESICIGSDMIDYVGRDSEGFGGVVWDLVQEMLKVR